MSLKRKILITVLTVLCVVCTVFAFGCKPLETVWYTVTFMDGQTQVGEPVKVAKGKKITEYPEPSRADADYVFDGWYKDASLTAVWNTEIERVNSDVTVYAGFLHISATPGNAHMSDTAFSNTVVWLQRGINARTEFKVELFSGVKISESEYAYGNVSAISESNLSGENGKLSLEKYKNHDDVFTVSYTPSQKPAGGVYRAVISCADIGATVDGLMFKGEGTENNPYLVTGASDLAEINTRNVEGGYYRVEQSFNADLSSRNILDFTFDGTLDGNGRTITLEASDCGLFGTLGENGTVTDLIVAGGVTNILYDCAGVIASVNRGEISYCTVSAGIDSKAGVTGTLEGGQNGITGGAGGVAGINYGKISCCTYSGQIKANVGGAGIAAINNGAVESCAFSGTIGAANAVEEGNSTKAYSYIGGIVALNYAGIERSTITGSGKILAQRANDGTNDFIGGIAAYNFNGGVISECLFDGIRVHGNRNVGGIAGANAGTVTHCYSGGAYHSGSKDHSYVGGLANIGGIVGLTADGGKTSNCIALANVYCYTTGGYKAAQNAENSIYLTGNLNSRNGIVPPAAPVGQGNTAVTESNPENFATSNYSPALTQEQIDALNGDTQAFELTANGFRLKCEGVSNVKEHIIKVNVEGRVYELSSLTGNKIIPASVAPEGSYVAGYAVINGGAVAFEYGKAIGYTDLEAYGVNVTLYPVIVEGEKPQSTVINVALWTRYINEDTAKALFAAFEKSQFFGDGYKIYYTALSSSNNANYKTDYEKGSENGAFNVTFAYVSTAVGGWQDREIAIYAYNVNSDGYANLKVGLNGTDKVLDDFAKFLETYEAKKILCPELISVTLMNGNEKTGEYTVYTGTTAAFGTPEAEEGYTFSGWATTAEAVEGETLIASNATYAELSALATDGRLTLYARFVPENEKPKPTLKVAVYKKFVDDEITQALEAAFAKYCKDNNIEHTELIFDTMTTGNGAAFTNDAASYDVAMGHKGGTSFVAKESKTVAILLNAANGGEVAYDRKAERLSDNELAVTFMQFLETDEAKAAMAGVGGNA